MTQEELAAKLKDANRIHVITSAGRARYRLRIENVAGDPLSEWRDVSGAESRYALQLSLFPGLSQKENLMIFGQGEEDYRMPIVSEEMLRARLYPATKD